MGFGFESVVDFHSNAAFTKSTENDLPILPRAAIRISGALLCFWAWYSQFRLHIEETWRECSGWTPPGTLRVLEWFRDSFITCRRNVIRMVLASFLDKAVQGSASITCRIYIYIYWRIFQGPATQSLYLFIRLLGHYRLYINLRVDEAYYNKFCLLLTRQKRMVGS